MGDLWGSNSVLTQTFAGCGAVIAFCALLAKYSESLVVLTLPDVQVALDVSDDHVGNILAIIRTGALFAVPIAMSADRLGRINVLIGCSIGFGVGSTVSALAPNIPTFVIAQTAARACTTTYFVIAMIVLFESVSSAHRGKMIGRYSLAVGLGEGLCALLYPLSEVTAFEWRLLYALPMPLLLLIGIATLYTAPVWRQFNRHNSLTRDSRLEDIPFFKGFRSLALLWFFFNLTFAAALSFPSKHLQVELGFPSWIVSLILIVSGALALVGNIIGPVMGKRFGARRTLAVLVIVAALAFVGFYLAPTVAPLLWLVGITALVAGSVVLWILTNELCAANARMMATTFSLIAGAAGAMAGLALESAAWQLVHSTARSTATVMILGAILTTSVISTGSLFKDRRNQAVEK